MEKGAPLRSVPIRPLGTVNPVHALAQVQRALPDLPHGAQRALALVDLAGAPRALAADELSLPEEKLARLLAVARKALRRTLAHLPANGWCERGERLISDRIDGVLVPPGAARLEAHLRGCERCVTHEQRLVQAHDQLVGAYLEAHPPSPVAVASTPPAELRAVEEPVAPGRALSLRGWQLAFVVGMLLAVAAVVLALLAITGAI